MANCQKCIRTTDIDEVGDATHHTFFEMLGNWSFGDYFKQEAIEWSWEFLTSSEWLNLDKKRLAVSVFAGDSDAPFDEEAFNIWKNLGVSEKRIARLPKKNNWWGPAGQTGPCGPDSEMFYWSGDADKVPESFNDDNVMWVEIWNDVFMQFNKNDQGQYEPLEQKNVDTGMGLERTLAVLNGLDDNYRTELFWPLIEKIEELSGKKYDGSEEVKKAMRIIADHIKAAVFLIADGVISSNTGRGYVLRKIIRRAMHYMGILSIKKGSLAGPADIVIKQYGDIYENLKNNIEKIKKEIIEEEYKVEKSIEEGLKAFRVVDKNKPKGEPITGEEAAYLYQTHSLSFDNTKGLAREYGRGVTDNFYEIAEEKTKEHQVLSRTASAGMFKGGLADASEETKKLHTAAHLMLAALRQVLGEHVYQKGSNITAERLRFDFSHPQKMTPEEIKKVEEIVNEKIAAKLPVVCEELSLDEAKAKGAMGVFEQKYGERVKIYGISGFSKEICGGPHVENTGELGKFKIKKEEASSAGVRRIKAVLE
ncbi:MAG: Alanine-tRNA ligase [Parcubacteria group bacterium GW2011_GWC2_42_6]|nr:MAG: Alanine-tRNA ligase [Parcubacteria group bacterium GW2011_GWC2_42_6]